MNASRTRRAALYVRVSTDRQTVENQMAKLTEVATARGWQIVATFTDAGISGAKGRKDGQDWTTCSSRRSAASSMW
jgi:DNA invertase Pin-like site-specific DNA recombinase